MTTAAATTSPAKTRVRTEYEIGRDFRLPVLVNNETPNLCAGCGRCCESMPGFTMPIEFGAPDQSLMFERLTKALASGRWAIDWWEGDIKPDGEFHRVCMIRPAIKGHIGIYHGSWGGPCTFLGKGGCELPFDYRPYDCRALIAKPLDGCDYKWGKTIKQKALVAIKWRPYQAVITRAADAVSLPDRGER